MEYYRILSFWHCARDTNIIHICHCMYLPCLLIHRSLYKFNWIGLNWIELNCSRSVAKHGTLMNGKQFYCHNVWFIYCIIAISSYFYLHPTTFISQTDNFLGKLFPSLWELKLVLTDNRAIYSDNHHIYYTQMRISDVCLKDLKLKTAVSDHF